MKNAIGALSLGVTVAIIGWCFGTGQMTATSAALMGAAWLGLIFGAFPE